ncbi:MAG: hypothetical protein ABR576_13110 [Thermoanaerobaculia bacterium]
MHRAVWLVLVSLCAAVPAIAQPAYYVATNGSNATGNGSAGIPWATITHAVNTVPDGSLVLVLPGTYDGVVALDRVFAQGITVRSQVPYQARLRHTGTVVRSFYGKGITLEGFDVAHTGPGAGALVIQIQDLIGPAGGADYVSRIVLRNNVLHDSYNNDILKINNGAGDITVEGNVFYNQTGSDEHIDVNSVMNVVVQDNVFFNDFAGSGRTNGNDTSSYIVIKDSNAGSDGNIGSRYITVRRNVFLHWEGSTGSYFVLIGEDGQPFHEARDVLVENNLMLGDSGHTMRAAFGVKGSRDVVFRHNTVSGNLPSLAFAFRLNREGANLANENIQLHNNVWSDPTGTMEDFSDTPPGDTAMWTLARNVYWNGGAAVPQDGAELVNFTDDATRIVANPALPGASGMVLPRWVPGTGVFADGSGSIREVFVRLVTGHGAPAVDSPTRDAANPSQSPFDDILGRTRFASPDIGAYEISPSAVGPLRFHTLAPCRVLDTRNPAGPRGGPALAGSSARLFGMAGVCGVPASARSVSANVTVTGPAASGNLRFYPGDAGPPLASAINFRPGQTRANNAILRLSGDGAAAVFVANDAPATVHFILDVTGYFE